MPFPPAIKPDPRPGPDFDPMDRIVESLQNIESFFLTLSNEPHDTEYLNTHLSNILALRRTISSQLHLLEQEPYNFSQERIRSLHQGNEQIFIYLEGAVGSLEPWNEGEFKKFIQVTGKELSKFDNLLTP